MKFIFILIFLFGCSDEREFKCYYIKSHISSDGTIISMQYQDLFLAYDEVECDVQRRLIALEDDLKMRTNYYNYFKKEKEINKLKEKCKLLQWQFNEAGDYHLSTCVSKDGFKVSL